MSAAAVPADAGIAEPAKKGKKKLLIMLVVGVLAFALAGGGAVFMMKKKAAAQAAEDGDEAVALAEHKAEKPDLKHPPTFLPLDPFVVNLSDKDADRYAQIGITFEVADAKFGELLKAYMPAIRNSILLILAQKSSADLLDRPGKEQLAGQIQREAARVMGVDVEEPEAPAPKTVAKDGTKDEAKAAKDGGDEEKPKLKKRKADAEPNPIRHVHFSNFIIQ